LAALTTENFTGPLQTIIPWCTNHFTETVIAACRERWGEGYWGFLMLGGMSGGGMGFFFDPAIASEASAWLRDALVRIKRSMQDRMPFAMDPVVYDFRINDRGSWSELLEGSQAAMPDGYYALLAPKLIRQELKGLSEQAQRDLMRLGRTCGQDASRAQRLLDRLLPREDRSADKAQSLEGLLAANGFDREHHEWLRAELLAGRIGLAENRLPVQTQIEDAAAEQLIDLRGRLGETGYAARLGERALRNGEVAVVSLAAGAGSRWTGGAGVVKGLHPFCAFDGRHRSFLEIHLAKSRRSCMEYECLVPHAFTTGYLTHEPIERYLGEQDFFRYPGLVYLSRGMAVGLRTVPTGRDLIFHWEETPQQLLDEQQQKVRESAQQALAQWARSSGEASDYVDNLPEQCMHPVGHWYEIPNLLRNGTLRAMLEAQPRLRYLMLHNIDTLGAGLDPLVLSQHIESEACLTFEVIGRRVDDRGGGLAQVDGKLRLLEGLAMPNDRDEFRLTYYSSMTTWIDIDRLLAVFGLGRKELVDDRRVEGAVRAMAARMPTYITLKDVKKRWGLGQEDVFPVAQFEKLWGDMSGLPDVRCSYVAVDTRRGQQLKDPAQLDPWVRDGSAAYVRSLCRWG
jgi:hypothetical protein